MLFCLYAFCIFVYLVSWADADSFSGLESVFTDTNVRVRRSTVTYANNSTYYCDTSNLPQPTIKHPAVLFADFNYNNCSSNGSFLRLRPNDFIKWGENTGGEVRTRSFTWSSMLVLPDVKVTFRACCPSGNEFIKTVDDWHDAPNMNLSVFDHPQLNGNNGIWYTKWLHWVMSFDIKVSPSNKSFECGLCYYGDCGLTNKCECADGYSGDTCLISPTSAVYPTQQKPLVLFEYTNYRGNYTQVNPNEFSQFSSNLRGLRVNKYQSMRVLYNRSVIFARNMIYTSKWNVGNNIPNIPEFMSANAALADPIWFNYDTSIALVFYVQVEGNSNCDNCSQSGVCYTGTCVCLPGYSGVKCDVKS